MMEIGSELIEFTYAVVRNFCVVTAMVLLIRNARWGCLLFSLWRKGDGLETEIHSPRTFPQWVVRAGTLGLSMVVLLALGPPTIEHVIEWFHPAKGRFIPLLALIILESLMLWRWAYFSHNMRASKVSMIILAALSVAIEIRELIQ